MQEVNKKLAFTCLWRPQVYNLVRWWWRWWSVEICISQLFQNLARNKNHRKKYHFGLHSKQSNLKEKFGDVKVVCMGGSEGRIKKFAEMAFDALKDDMNLEADCAEVNLAESAGRYVMYKVRGNEKYLQIELY